MIRLITIILCLLVSVFALAEGDHPAKLEQSDPLAQKGDGPHSNSANQRSNSQAQNQERDTQAALLIAIEKHLRAIADHTTPDLQAEYSQAGRDWKALDVAERDVIQQKAMAKYARLMYFAACAGVFVGVCGLVALVLILRATNIAAKAAQKSAEAAQDAARASLMQARQNRAGDITD